MCKSIWTYNPAQTFPRALTPSFNPQKRVIGWDAARLKWFVTAFSSTCSRGCRRGHTGMPHALHRSCLTSCLTALKEVQWGSKSGLWTILMHTLLFCRLWGVRAGIQTDVSNATFNCCSPVHWYSAGNIWRINCSSVAFNNFHICIAGLLIGGGFPNFFSAAYSVFLFFSFAT